MKLIKLTLACLAIGSVVATVPVNAQSGAGVPKQSLCVSKALKAFKTCMAKCDTPTSGNESICEHNCRQNLLTDKSTCDVDNTQ